MKQEEIKKMLNRLIKLKEREVLEREKFTNPKFRDHLQILADSVLLNTKQRPTVSIEYSPKSNTTAYTNGNGIHLNAANSVSAVYNLESSRMLALMGILYHECAHVKFLDFETENAIIKGIETGKFFGSFRASNAEEEQYINELNTALKKPLYRKIFKYVYHELANIFSDVHDEGKLCEEFHGIVERSIIFSTEALRSTAVSVESMAEALKEQQTDILSVMFSLILIYARFGKIVTEDEEKAYANIDCMKKLIKLSPYIEIGCQTDDITEKFTAINQCLLVLWPYIKEQLEQEDNQAPEDNAGDDNQKSETDSSESNSSEKSTDGKSSNSNAGGTSSDTQNSKASQSSNQNSDGSRSGSMCPEIDENAAQSIMDSLTRASSRTIPNASPEPQNAVSKHSIKGSSDGNSSNNSDKDNGSDKCMSEQQAQNIVQNTLNQITRDIAKEKSENELNQKIQQETNIVINAVSMTSTHKRKKTHIVHPDKVSDRDIQIYKECMKELAPISKALQKQMLNVLRDLKEGDVLKHRSFGKRVEARDTYRLDGKYFSTKKLPQDLPDMAIMVLIDQSGSTAGQRIEAERKSAMLLHDFAVGLDIPIMICGHHTMGSGSGIYFYPYAEFERVTDKDCYKLAQIEYDKQYRGNRDGMAINIAAELLSRRPEEVKLLLILSDGQPYDVGYSGNAAKDDIRSIVKAYKRKGIQTIAAAIGDDKERIADIYKDGYFDMSNLSTLPKTLVKMVKKRIIP